MPSSRCLILASGSPRRRELMGLLQVPFEVLVPDVDERPRPGETPDEMPQRFSQLKAEWVAREIKMAAGKGDVVYPTTVVVAYPTAVVVAYPTTVVVAADTIVVHKGKVLGKPRDADHACVMLRRLRGERHVVLSGVTVMDVVTGRQITDLCESQVWLRPMDDAEIATYVASGDPLDKAAAYAIQNTEFAPVTRVVGCPANVMGLPLCHVVRSLRQLGMALPPTRATRCQIQHGLPGHRHDYQCALTGYVMTGKE